MSWYRLAIFDEEGQAVAFRMVRVGEYQPEGEEYGVGVKARELYRDLCCHLGIPWKTKDEQRNQTPS